MWDWLSIVVIVAIVLVVVDGLRRKFRERNALKVKLDDSIAAATDPDDELSSELPSGGARTIPRDAAHSPRRQRDGDRRERRERIEPDLGDPLDDGDDVEAGMADLTTADDLTRGKAVDEQGDWQAGNDDAPEGPLDGAGDPAGEDWADDQVKDEIPAQPEQTMRQADSVDDRDDFDDFSVDYTAASSPAVDEASAGEEETPLMADSQDAPASSRRRQKKKSSRTFSERFFRHSSVQNELPLDDDDSSVPSEEADGDSGENDEVEEVIIINVMAPAGQPFDGSQLLQILLRQGMRLGHMSIFHRHADNNGSGPVMFSMANMVKPGTFDMATMDAFTTPGVSLFTQLPSKLPHMRNFDLMLETARCLRDELGGELKDENRSDLTRQTIEHYRQRIQDFELHRLARK